MKRSVFAIAVLISVLLFGVSADANLLINGDFEDGDIGQVGSVEIPGWSNWGDAGWHNSDAGATIDSKAMKFWWDSVGLWQDFSATAGQTYAYSVQVMDWSGDTSANNWDLQIEAEFYDAESQQLTSVVLGYFDSGVELDDTWVQIGDSVVAPAETAYGRVVIRAVDWQENISGSVYFDNVSVVPEPATLTLFCIGGLFFRRSR